MVTDAAATGLRERKKARTRELIEATALELFARDGFEATTVEAITDACEVSPRTFFRYFASKHEVLQAPCRARQERLIELLAERPADEPALRSLRAALGVLALDYEKDRDAVLLRFRVFDRNPTLAAWGQEVQLSWHQAVATALAVRLSPVDARLAAAAAGAALLAALDLWRWGGGTADLQALTLEAFDRLGGGLDG